MLFEPSTILQSLIRFTPKSEIIAFKSTLIPSSYAPTKGEATLEIA
jgi:hypothetical protein